MGGSGGGWDFGYLQMREGKTNEVRCERNNI